MDFGGIERVFQWKRTLSSGHAGNRAVDAIGAAMGRRDIVLADFFLNEQLQVLGERW